MYFSEGRSVATLKGLQRTRRISQDQVTYFSKKKTRCVVGMHPLRLFGDNAFWLDGLSRCHFKARYLQEIRVDMSCGAPSGRERLAVKYFFCRNSVLCLRAGGAGRYMSISL